MQVSKKELKEQIRPLVKEAIKKCKEEDLSINEAISTRDIDIVPWMGSSGKDKPKGKGNWGFELGWFDEKGAQKQQIFINDMYSGASKKAVAKAKNLSGKNVENVTIKLLP